MRTPSSGTSGSSNTPATGHPSALLPPTFSGYGAPSSSSTCVEPDHRELIRSVATVLHRRVRDNETADSKVTLPLFCEDTHTEPEPEERYALSLPLLHQQLIGCPTLYTLRKLPPPPSKPREYPIPDPRTVATFIENIWHKARLTPQSLVITLIYIDRLEARSEGVLLHARCWRPIVFASLLLASKVWHDISYWNSDFSSICPMFHIRNINRMERAYLTLLQYNTLISASQYAQYYFSLRHAVRQPAAFWGEDDTPRDPTTGATRERSESEEGPNLSGNFRSKYFLALNVTDSSRELQEKSEMLVRNGVGDGVGAMGGGMSNGASSGGSSGKTASNGGSNAAGVASAMQRTPSPPSAAEDIPQSDGRGSGMSGVSGHSSSKFDRLIATSL